MADRLLIVDFGSQVTQLIARRVREAGVYCEVHPFQQVDKADIEKFDPRGIILSGGPASVTEGQSPSANPAIFAANLPVLGICYGGGTWRSDSAARSRAATTANLAAPRSRSSRPPPCSTACGSRATASRSG